MQYKIPAEKELKDCLNLADTILKDGWIDKNTIIVNCSPDYSSIVTQIVNHKLSVINKHELFEQINLEMPYPNSSQVFDSNSNSYVLFDTYLKNWVLKNIYPNEKYLFIDSATIRGQNFNKVKVQVRDKCNYRFASLYVDINSKFTPDFYVEKFTGELIFWWENPQNPNWK